MEDFKRVPPLTLATLCERLRREGASLVFTNGVFDLLHPGHIRYLYEARNLGTHLIVALNSDVSARRIKGEKRPLVPLNQRLEVLASLESVSFVTWFEEDTPVEAIRLVRPDVLVKGGDWEPDRIVGKDFVEAYGGKVFVIPYTWGHSTTALIEKILKLPR